MCCGSNLAVYPFASHSHRMKKHASPYKVPALYTGEVPFTIARLSGSMGLERCSIHADSALTGEALTHV